MTKSEAKKLHCTVDGIISRKVYPVVPPKTEEE